MKETRIFANDIEPEALEQFRSAMEQPFAVRGALLPDAHAGYTLPIGAVIATKEVILPSWVGYDIGCGMCALKTEFHPGEIGENADAIYKEIYSRIPTGFNHNKKNTHWDYHDIPVTSVTRRIFDHNGLKQLGSLGSGNHFIEIGRDEQDHCWIIIHSGSRGIGHAVATHYMKLASRSKKAKEGHYGFKVHSDQGKDYITDLNFCLAFALENRRKMMQRVITILYNVVRKASPPEVDFSEMINRNHNHAECKEGLWIHRKGATHAEKGMKGVVPGNMRDGSFIVEGLGNPQSLWSSSHGAGRVMGRRKAKKSLSLEDFRETMSGIKAKVSTATLDESPFAYKDLQTVMNKQKDLVSVLHHIKPIINIKG